jgi:hypothetical protein
MEEYVEENTKKKYNEMLNKIALKHGKKFDEFYNGLFPPSIEYGIKKLKRKTLGFFGTKTKKSLDELAGIFTDLGMTGTIAEAKFILPELGSFEGTYGLARTLKITPNPKDENLYLIESYTFD